ncbi:hypothetical protein [Aminobacter sp. MDW-2]|uniref:hypothetical protein n=1 Tax=Aminobacter sp. MDW-2 TaxID=2666139 RepID=UPI0012B05F8F|nr:hypothetical protein [Aminobacter sp. MDW-2]MRX31893.1 hypothetical protein [Aminobacter sp. MDW-2]QNH32367.1 hypothetical protein H5P29_17600 [Aminobacter sp. MDW-2]
MRDSTKWQMAGWSIFLISTIAIHLRSADVKIASLHIITAIALATSAILKALGK